MARSRDDDYTDEPPRRRRRDDDDDDEDRPRRRPRDDDEDEDDDRPRARRRRDEEDDEDRPRPRRRRSIKRELTGMDGLFGNTHIVVLVLFSCLCGVIAFILGLIGVITCTDEKAKQNAMITMIVSGVLVVIGIGIRLAAFAVAR